MDRNVIPIPQLVALVDNGYAIHEVNQETVCTHIVAVAADDSMTLSLSNAQLQAYSSDFLQLLTDGSQQPVDNCGYCFCTYTQPYCWRNENRVPGLQCPFCRAAPARR